LVAGAAAGAVAATWLGKRRHLRAVEPSREPRVEPREPRVEPREHRVDRVDPSREHMVESDSAELPIGRSADPAIDYALSRSRSAHEETSGGSLLAEDELRDGRTFRDGSLDEVWNAMPGFAEGEQSEGYDAVMPEDMGAVWLERATQTTHEANPHASDPNDVPSLDQLAVRRDDELLEDVDDELDGLDGSWRESRKSWTRKRTTKLPMTSWTIESRGRRERARRCTHAPTRSMQSRDPLPDHA